MADGSPDDSFGNSSEQTRNVAPGHDVARAVAVHPDGSIFLGGTTAGGDFALVKFDVGGNFVWSRTYALGSGFDSANAIALQDDNGVLKIVLVGETDNGTNADFGVARINASTGNLDPTFGTGGVRLVNVGGQDIGRGLAVQPDGKLVVAGYSSAIGGNHFAVARLEPNGSDDTTFSGDGRHVSSLGGPSDRAHGVGLTAEGKIILGGFKVEPGGNTSFAAARYEGNSLPPMVESVEPFLSGGAVSAGISSISIRFSESAIGAGLGGNYELRSLGPDSLLGTPDDIPFTISASYDPVAFRASLSFHPLPEGVYRFTIQDTITDSAGLALDGDADGIAGGDRTRDFVADAGYLHARISSFTEEPGANFGSAVATDGSRIVIGAPGDTFDVFEQGVAYVVNRETGERLTLTSPNAAFGRRFGHAVGLFEQYVAVSEFAFGNGWIYVFDAVSGALVWSRGGFNNLDEFGTSVAVSNGQVAVGAPARGSGSSGQGRVYVFELHTGALPHFFASPIAFDHFGASVALDDGTLIVGAPRADIFTTDDGAAITYNSVTGTHLDTYANSSSNTGDHFGAAVAVSGDFVLIGAPNEDTNGADSGAAHLYGPFVGHRSIPSPFQRGRGFGTSVAVSDTLALVGVTSDGITSASAAFVQDFFNGYSRILYNPSFESSDGFGATVAISGESAVIGASESIEGIGAAHTFDVVAPAWLFPNYDQLDLTGLGAGQLIGYGSSRAFDGLGRLHVAGTEFRSTQRHTLDDLDQTYVTSTATVAGLSVHREITTPSEGAYFVRTVDVFENPTASDISVPARIVGNLGSNAATTVFATSDGDTVLETTDEWFGTDDADGSGTPAIVHYLRNADGLAPASVNRIGDNVEWTYELTIPAGQTVRLAHFTITATSRAEAAAVATTLITPVGMGSQAAAFLTNEELASLVNFYLELVVTVDLSATPDSSPSLSGSINDSSALVEVTVGGQTVQAQNNQNGRWTLANDVLAPLASGVYDVIVHATAGTQRSAFDDTANELLVHDAPLLITEFLADNVNTISDEDGDFSDWIEIYNPYPVPVPLLGWMLTDGEQVWQFPSTAFPGDVVPPEERIVVWASGKDRIDACATQASCATPWHIHTNFKLAREGGYLALRSPVALAWELGYPEQQPDMSYGNGGSLVTWNFIEDQSTVQVMVPSASNNPAVYVPSVNDYGWGEPGFNTAGWTVGRGGAGFELNASSQPNYVDLIDVNLGPSPLAMRPASGQGSTSAYIRIPFHVTDPNAFEYLTLAIRYDDGFAAYLNGQLIHQENALLPLTFASAATAIHDDTLAVDFQHFDVTNHLSLLQPGQNVLAIHGLDRELLSTDFLIEARLTARAEDASTMGLRFLPAPTPGQPNGTGYIDRVSDTTFDHDRGFFNAPFSLVIGTATQEATIRYTLDNSPPSEIHGVVYTGPIPISQTTVVRAIAYRDGYLPTNIDTQTYLFLNDVIQQSHNSAVADGWPAAPVNDQQFRYHMNTANPPYAPPVVIDSLRNIPSISLTTDQWNLTDSAKGIYVNAIEDGRAWERPVSMELIDPDAGASFQIDAGMRIRGGFSRASDVTKHGFRLFFREEYGTDQLTIPLFGEEGTDKFAHLDLRTPQNSGWPGNGQFVGTIPITFTRDVFSRDTQRDMGEPYTRSRYYHVYLNGQYWGVYQSEERPEADYAASYFGGSVDDYDVIKADGFNPAYAQQNLYPTIATDGTIDEWANMWNLVVSLSSASPTAAQATYMQLQGKNPDGSDNALLPVYLDVDNLINYLLVSFYTGNEDGPMRFGSPSANWFASRSRDPNARKGWTFFQHDAEISLFVGGNPDVTGPFLNSYSLESSNPQFIHDILRARVLDYRLRFADLVQRHFFHEGALTSDEALARHNARVEEVRLPIIADSARWSTGQTPTYWQNNVNQVNNVFIRPSAPQPDRTAVTYSQLQGDGLTTPIPVPGFFVDGAPQHGGAVSPDAQLTIQVSGSPTIYYTTDGTDPRLPGGAVAVTATAYTGEPLDFDRSTRVSTRALDATNRWSALTEAVFTFSEPLRIVELMYHPAALTSEEISNGFTDREEFEYIEVHNTSVTRSVNLDGWQLTDGVGFVFPPLTLLPGEYAVVARNQAAFAARYGTEAVVAGQYGGTIEDYKLNNAGENIRLVDASGATVHDFAFDDAWYPETDGDGYSLVAFQPADDSIDWGTSARWRASRNLGGSPGGPEPSLPPTANPGGPYTIAEGQPLALDASASSDPDDDTLTYSWDLNGDGTFGDAIGESLLVDVTTLQGLGIADGPNEFQVRVRVDDGHDHVVTSEPTTLTIENVPPTLELFGPDEMIETEGELYFLGFGPLVDPGLDELISYRVHWGDGASEMYSGAGSLPHYYDFVPADTVRTIVVDAEDEDGWHVAAGTRDVLIRNVVPTVTIDSLATADPTPRLSGTINDTQATVEILVGGQTVPAVNLQDGRWELADNLLAPLAAGVYNVVVRAVDADSDEVFDSTTGELMIDPVPPTAAILELTEGYTGVGRPEFVVSFNEPVAEAGAAENYELRGIGPDALLGTADDVLEELTAFYNSQFRVAVLSFPPLAAGVYRLTIRDAIVDAVGSRLDGNADGTAGGHWTRDFVVVAGSAPRPLLSPDRFLFDVSRSEIGAGQLVQGTSNAFDGYGRLYVDGQPFAPTATGQLADFNQTWETGEQDITVSAPPVSYFHRAFVTFHDVQIDSTQAIPLEAGRVWGLAEADYNVNFAAFHGGFLPNWDGVAITWKAIMSDSTSDARDRIQILGPIYNTNGDLVATSAADLWDGNLANPIQYDELGDLVTTLMKVWTGTLANGDNAIVHCGNWKNPGATGHIGIPDRTNSGWLSSGGNSCLSAARLYGISPPIPVGPALDVRREVTVPFTGGEEFARTVDSFYNGAASPVTTTVRIVGNVGSDAATTVFATSDGDLVVEPTDQWFATDDADGSGAPALVHFVHGPAGLVPDNVAVTGDNVDWTYTITVPAGETLRLAHFTIQETTRAAALAAAGVVVTPSGFGGQAAAFLTAEELTSLANFQFESSLIGDLDHDNDVDRRDAAILALNFGRTGATPDDGDLQGDGNVDLVDLALLQSHLGETLPGPSPSPSASPAIARAEPLAPSRVPGSRLTATRRRIATPRSATMTASDAATDAALAGIDARPSIETSLRARRARRA